MLSRVADSLFWMARYIERAENIARIVDVNLQLLLDYQKLDDDALTEHWEPLIISLGDDDLFYELYKTANSRSVTEFLTFNPDNPNSILSCIIHARENARSVRDQISSEMWEEINRLYLYMRSKNARKTWRDSPSHFYGEIKQSSYLLQGLTNATVPHDEGREFTHAGRFLERADKTTRLLDVKYHILLPRGVQDVGGAVDTVQWAAVLRSCSAYDAYQQIYASDILPWNVAEMLIFTPNFPRSIRFCARTLDSSLRNITGSGPGGYINDAEKHSGRVLSELNYSSIEDVFRTGLHEYLDDLQKKFNDIGQALYDAFIDHHTTSVADEIQLQQQQ